MTHTEEMRKTNLSQDKHIYVIDVVRVTAAVMVCMFHLTWKRDDYANVMPYGWIGVEVFFLISGIAISGSIMSYTPLAFIKNRFLRIYPTAWICLMISLFAFLFLTSADALDAGAWVRRDVYAIINSILLVKGPFVASAYWTLPIELAFYMVILVAIILFKVKFQRFTLCLAVASSIYNILLACAWSGLFPTKWVELGYGLKNILLLRHGIYFSMGIYIYMINQRSMKRIDWTIFVLCYIGSLLEIYSRSCLLYGHYALSDGKKVVDASYLAVRASIAWTVFVMLLLQGMRLNKYLVFGERIKKLLRAFGLLTYPLYLIHEIVGVTLILYINFWLKNFVLSLLISLFVIVLISYLISCHCEPLLRRFLIKAGTSYISPFIPKKWTYVKRG